MLAWEGSIVNQSLVLVNTRSKWYIVVLAPSTKRMKQENWVFISLFDELLTSIFQQKDVSVVKWVTYLECVDCICTAGLDLVSDLLGSVSVLVHAIVESDAFGEVHACTRNEPVALILDNI